MSHPDNTIKALKGEEMFVERWQCRFGWHRWGKWGQPQKVSYHMKQTRCCTDCGMQAARTIPGADTV